MPDDVVDLITAGYRHVEGGLQPGRVVGLRTTRRGMGCEAVQRDQTGLRRTELPLTALGQEIGVRPRGIEVQ